MSDKEYVCPDCKYPLSELDWHEPYAAWFCKDCQEWIIELQGSNARIGKK
jgi:hypothetical protein